MTDSHSPQIPERLGRYQKIGVEPLARGRHGRCLALQRDGASLQGCSHKIHKHKRTKLMREIQALALRDIGDRMSKRRKRDTRAREKCHAPSLTWETHKK